MTPRHEIRDTEFLIHRWDDDGYLGVFDVVRRYEQFNVDVFAG